jgi:transketolase
MPTESASGEGELGMTRSGRLTSRSPELLAMLADRAMFSRLETVRLAKIAGAGHYTGAFSAAEIFAVLYYERLRLDPANPAWPDRDRFVLSKGHAAIGWYSLLADRGYFDMALLDDYTRLGSWFGDHPDMRKVPGADFSSGSLGHGLSISVGMALAARIQSRSYRTYCLCGDGELGEGQNWEAAMAASNFRLGNLTCIIDRNQLSIDGPTEQLMRMEPLDDRFTAFGWQVQRIDGHDLEAILDAFDLAEAGDPTKPQMIIADTVKGRGVQQMELDVGWHVGKLVGQDYDDVIDELKAGLRPVRNTAPIPAEIS